MLSKNITELKMKYNPSTKQKIYTVAKKLFLEEGFDVSSRKIAKEADVNLGLITYYFKTKNNIALMILKENYEIIALYLKYAISPDDDLLLYLIAFLNISYRTYQSGKGHRFFTQMFEEDLIEESLLNGNNQTDLYQKLVDTYMGNNGNSPSKNMALFNAVLEGVTRNLIINMKKQTEIDHDDLFSYTIYSFFWGLGISFTQKDVDDLKERSNQIADKVIAKYPQLIDPFQYLFQENSFKGE